MSTTAVRRSTGLRRSWGLVQAFRVEQTDPDRFYSLMAHDMLAIVQAYVPVRGKRVLDVGAGRPQFSQAFVDAGADYVAADADPKSGHDLSGAAVPIVTARGEALAIGTGTVDVALAANVFEHVPHHQALGSELIRVTRAGGLVVVSYTNWLSPWGGHETSPYHYLGGEWAVRRYERHYGRRAKNRVGETAFRVSVADGLDWARKAQGAELLSARPRYYPDWMHGLVHLPLLREFATWNLLLVLRRT